MFGNLTARTQNELYFSRGGKSVRDLKDNFKSWDPFYSLAWCACLWTGILTIRITDIQWIILMKRSSCDMSNLFAKYLHFGKKSVVSFILNNCFCLFFVYEGRDDSLWLQPATFHFENCNAAQLVLCSGKKPNPFRSHGRAWSFVIFLNYIFKPNSRVDAEEGRVKCHLTALPLATIKVAC